MSGLSRVWVVVSGLSACLAAGCGSGGPDPMDDRLAELGRRTDELSALVDTGESDTSPVADRARALSAATAEADAIGKELAGIEAGKLKREQFDKARALLERSRGLLERTKVAMEKVSAELKMQPAGR